MTEPLYTTGIDATTSEGRIELIRMGLTPRAIERAYNGQRIREFAREKRVELPSLTEAARAWGIKNPGYRRFGE